MGYQDNGVLFFFAQSILGQFPFNWPTPDGYPDTQDYWANTGGLLNRWRLSFFSYAPFNPVINVFEVDYTNLLGGADTIASVVDAMVSNVLMRPLLSQDRSILINWMVTETGQRQNDTLATGLPESIAAAVAAVLISSAYFQMR